MHANLFQYFGYIVDIVDLKEENEKLIYEGNYLEYNPRFKYDIIWSSHMLEHLLNPGCFFDYVFSYLREGGYLAITVPPMLPKKLRLYHPGQYNGGMLMTYLIHSGFNCQDISIGQYGYNLSVILKKNSNQPKNKIKCLPNRISIKGRIFNGLIQELNWNVFSVPSDYIIDRYESFDEFSMAKVPHTLMIKNYISPGFFIINNNQNIKPLCYYMSPHLTLHKSSGYQLDTYRS